MPVEPHGQSYARKILRAFPEGSFERAIADANAACRRKGSHARCGLPFCLTCGNAAIQQRQLYVTSRMANHPDHAIFAVTILADAVPFIFGSDANVSSAVAVVRALEAKLRAVIESSGVADYWLYGAIEYEVRYPSRYSRFVRDCLRECHGEAQPPYVIVPHAHLVMAARWRNRAYLTGDQITRVLTGGGAVASRSDRHFHRPEQVLVQPLRTSVVEDVPKLVDYGMKFRLRSRPGPEQAYHPPEVVRELALLFSSVEQARFLIDIESRPAKPVRVLPPSARKSPLLLTLNRERETKRIGAPYDGRWNEQVTNAAQASACLQLSNHWIWVDRCRSIAPSDCLFAFQQRRRLRRLCESMGRVESPRKGKSSARGPPTQNGRLELAGAPTNHVRLRRYKHSPAA